MSGSTDCDFVFSFHWDALVNQELGSGNYIVLVKIRLGRPAGASSFSRCCSKLTDQFHWSNTHPNPV